MRENDSINTIPSQIVTFFRRNYQVRRRWQINEFNELKSGHVFQLMLNSLFSC